MFEKHSHYKPAYTENNINFRKQNFLDNKIKNQNISFIITEKSNPTILFCGYIIKNNKNELHTFGHPCLLIQLSQKTEINKIEFNLEMKKIFNKINGTLWIKSNTNQLFLDRIFSNLKQVTSNNLVIDLKYDNNYLWTNIRKRYKSYNFK